MQNRYVAESLASIDAVADDDHAAMQNICIGLLQACPLGGNPERCQAHDLRLLPQEQRLAWLQSRSGAELKAMYKRHIICMADHG